MLGIKRYEVIDRNEEKFFFPPLIRASCWLVDFYLSKVEYALMNIKLIT